MEMFVSIISKCLVAKTFLCIRYKWHVKSPNVLFMKVKDIVGTYFTIQKIGELHF